MKNRVTAGHVEDFSYQKPKKMGICRGYGR